MPSASRSGYVSGAVGSKPLYIRELDGTITSLGLTGGLGGFWNDSLLAIVHEVLPIGYQFVPPNWTQIVQVDKKPMDLLHVSDIGWLASNKPQGPHENWSVWGSTNLLPEPVKGAVCIGMGHDGTFALSGINIKYDGQDFAVEIYWPDGKRTLFPTGTLVYVSSSLVSYLLPNENRIRLCNSDGDILIKVLDSHQYPGPAWYNVDGILWLWYTTTDGRHVCHPALENDFGYQWKIPNQYGQDVRHLENGQELFTYAVGSGETEDVIKVEYKVLGLDMVPLKVVEPIPPNPIPVPPMPNKPDKAKVKEEALNSGAEYANRLTGVPLDEAKQGALQGWDKFPDTYLPSTFELGNFALYRSGHGHITDEKLNEHQKWALDKTLEIEKKAYGGSNGGGGGGSILPLFSRDGSFVRTDGQIWKYRGVTAFTAISDILAGNESKLDEYIAWTLSIKANAWRIFGMWRNTGLNPVKVGDSYYQAVEELCKKLVGRGILPHYVVFCDQTSDSPILLTESQQNDHIFRIRDLLKDTAYLPEIMNEPDKNGAFAHRFKKNDLFGAPWARGASGYPDSVGTPLDYMTMHTDRSHDWPRKAKDLYEIAWMGVTNPDTGQVYEPTRLPMIAGEPIRIDDTNGTDYADYAALCEFWSAGSLIHGGFRSFDSNHTTDMQNCIPLSGKFHEMALKVSDIWDASIPSDLPQKGRYTAGHLGDCPLVHDDNWSSRTYGLISGNRAHMVVVQPNSNHQVIPKGSWRVVERVHNLFFMES